MYTQPPPHPRAAAALGAAILAAWIGALGIAFATDRTPAPGNGRTAPSAHAGHAPGVTTR